MPFELKQAPPGAIAREARQIIKLALPMMIAQIAQVATGFVDTVMSGRVSTDDLAAVSLGASVFVTFYVTLMGVVTALNPILSHELGAGEHERVGETARQGVWFGLFTGLAGAALLLSCAPLLRAYLPMAPDVVEKVILFTQGTAMGMPAMMMHRALHAYASSTGHPRAIMVVSLLALALNIPLNYALIHGLYGLPALGGAGCGWATGAVFWFNCITLFIYLAWKPELRRYHLLEKLSRPDWHRFKSFLKLGVPIGLSFFLEVSLFSFIALLIAQLGAVTVAAHQSVLNFSSLVYMLPQSIGVALTVRVGQHVGAGDMRQARFICGVGLGLGLMSAVGTMLLVLALREPIMHMYSPDPRVAATGAALLLFAAVFQLSDAMQTIASSALRGYKLTKIPMFIHLLAFWGVGLLLGAALGLSDWIVPRMGVYGFWAALVLSLTAAAALLTLYLARQSRRHLKLMQG